MQKQDGNKDSLGVWTLLLVTAFPVLIWAGYVLSDLWQWFIVPVFHLPPMSAAEAAGVMMISGMLFRRSESGQRTASEVATLQAATVLLSAYVWAAGWILSKMAG